MQYLKTKCDLRVSEETRNDCQEYKNDDLHSPFKEGEKVKAKYYRGSKAFVIP